MVSPERNYFTTRSYFFVALTVLLISGCSSEVELTAADKQKISTAVSKSEDYLTHKDAFDTASAMLVKKGTCTAEELQEMGGWWRSVQHKPEPVYFTYCGGVRIENRIYINAETRDIFR